MGRNNANARYHFEHFAMRVQERIGQDVDAEILWNLIIDLIGSGSDHIQFIARLCRETGRRVWRFVIRDEPFFVVFDHEKNCPVTIYKKDWIVRPRHGAPIKLEQHV